MLPAFEGRSRNIVVAGAGFKSPRATLVGLSQSLPGHDEPWLRDATIGQTALSRRYSAGLVSGGGGVAGGGVAAAVAFAEAVARFSTMATARIEHS